MNLTMSQESLISNTSSCESSLGSEGLGPHFGANLTDPSRAAVALLPICSSLSSGSSLDCLVTHSLSQSNPTSSQFLLSSRSQSPSKQNLSDNKCHICSYATNRRSNLIRHLETMHKNQDDRSLECCGEMFSSKSELREHKRQAHIQGYRCYVCSRTFCRRALLNRHMNVHSGQKDFTCGCCDYATSHKSNLERHIYRLHGETAGDSFKASRALLNKRRPTEDRQSYGFSAKRCYSLPSGLDNLDLDQANSEVIVTPPIGSSTVSVATGKPRLCLTSYKCPKCNLSFASQIETSVHSLNCEILTNCAEDIIKAAVILVQMKHSN